MIEFVKHSIGLCGEAHPSLLTLCIGTPIIGHIIFKLRLLKKYGYDY